MDVFQSQLQNQNSTTPQSPKCGSINFANVTELTSYLVDYFKNYTINSIFTINTMVNSHIHQVHDGIFDVITKNKKYSKKLSFGYFQLMEQIKIERENMALPFLSIKDFEKMVISCKISSSVETIAEYLNQVGFICYFNENKFAFLSNTIILYPKWLVNLLSTIISLKNVKIIKDGILFRHQLPHLWYDYSQQLYNYLLEVFNKMELIYTVNPSIPQNTNSPTTTRRRGTALNLSGGNSSAVLDSNESYSIVPSILPTRKPQIIANLFDNDQINSTEIYLERIYKFTEFYPFGLLSRLIVRLLHVVTPINYWRFGFLFEFEQQKALLEFEIGDELNVKVTGKNPSKLLRIIVDNIDLLLKSFYHCKKLNVIIPFTFKGKNYPTVTPEQLNNPNEQEKLPFSYHFTNSSSNFLDHYFPLDLLEDAVAHGVHEVLFQSENLFYSIPIKSIAPDLLLEDLSEMIIKWEDLQIEKQIGQGAFGTVYSGHYGEAKVAVKLIEVSEEMKKEAFYEFRREVTLCSELNQEYIVRLHAVCFNPWCLVMEFMPFGDLYTFLNDPANIISWKVILKIAHNISEAVRFLHSFRPKIIHRDLKSPNCLVCYFLSFILSIYHSQIT